MIYNSAIVLNSNVVGFWPLNGDATDAKNANNGTLVAGSFDTGTVAPIIGQSYALKNGYVNISTNSNYDFGTTTDFSVEAWWNPSAFSAGTTLLYDHRSAGAGGNDGYWLGQVTGANTTINLTIAGTRITGPSINSASTWYHCVVSVVRTSNTIFYINGVSTTVAGATSALSASSTGQVTLGARSFTQPALTIVGSLSNVAVYNYAMPSDIVQQHYNQFLDGIPTVPNVGMGKVL